MKGQTHANRIASVDATGLFPWLVPTTVFLSIERHLSEDVIGDGGGGCYSFYARVRA